MPSSSLFSLSFDVAPLPQTPFTRTSPRPSFATAATTGRTAQSSTKTITLSREALIEIQTTVDLFIEEITRRQASAGGPSTTPVQSTEPQLSGARN